MQNFIEKRRHLRLDFSLPMRYRKVERSSQGFKGTLIKDISRGGLRMTAFEFLPLNLRLAMELPLVSGLKPVEGTARVAWVKQASLNPQYEVGVEFINLNHGDAEQITKFISSNDAAKV